MPSLETYRARRDFSRTPEPRGHGRAGRSGAAASFVIHKHAARRLHYDLRLEHDGVLWSWAVTKGPSLDPSDKRLAVHVEDHPLDYRDFEGRIPEGEYGAGSVIVWDEGRWIPEGDADRGLAKGHLAFTLEGHKLSGAWHLVRMKPRRGEARDNWLLIKADDAAARQAGDILEEEPASVRSGRRVEEPSARRAENSRRRPKGGARAPRRRKGTAALPDFVAPCFATLRDQPGAGEGWVHEVKFDGYRIEARIDHGKVSLLTRTGLDWTGRFGRTLEAALQALPCETALIDGEVVALDDAGISSFAALQRALSEHRTDKLVYFVFDLLHLDGRDLRPDPLLARKERLEDLLVSAPGDSLRYSEHVTEPGETMLAHTCRLGLEGVVSKRADAPYRSGRGLDWIKSKCAAEQEFVIAGYTPSEAAGRHLKSLAVGYYEKGRLCYAGQVGTGFDAATRAMLRRRLDRLGRAAPPASAGRPPRAIVWVEPKLVAEIAFRTWTADGLLRQAAFKGLREDKPPAAVVAERPPAPARRTAGTPARKSGRIPATASTRPAGAAAGSRGTVMLTHADKLLWPDPPVSKQRLLDHYRSVWPQMRPHIVRRPLSLLRAPDGIGQQTFFQKHASRGMHDAVATFHDPEDGEELIFIDNFDGLTALVQLGTVEIHAWQATIDAIETPDEMVFDLDPAPGVEPERVRQAALALRDRLASLGLDSFAKLSGGKGFHVVAPLVPAADWAAVKRFASDFAHGLAEAEPKAYTATLAKKARAGRIFIDYLRNGRGATAVLPFSPRARPGASLAVPVPWGAVEAGIAPADCRIGSRMLDEIMKAEPWVDFRKAAKRLPKP